MEPLKSSARRRWTRKRVTLAASLVALAAGLVLVVLNSGLLGALDAVVRGLRETGPVVFFGAMALLPAAGFPMMAFVLAAGPVFGPALGTGWVVAWSLTAVAANLLLSYWLADRALRPLVGRLLAYFEFRLPEGRPGMAWQTTLLVRLTPGPPYWVQSYLLGLIRVPLAPYLVVSLLVMAGYLVALVFGGAAIARGDGRLALATGGVLLVLVTALQLWRRRATRRVAAVLAPLPAK